MLRAALFSITAPPRTQPPASDTPDPEKRPTQRLKSRWARIDWWRASPVLLAALLSLVYMVWRPRTVDLAAHVFRSELFGKEGFTIWNGQWYGGHHTPAYSVLSPGLGWLLTPQFALAVCAIASAALYEPLARGWFGERRARWGSIWFGVATGALLFTARLPFAIGVVFGLASLLALQRRRRVLAIAMAFLCPLGSPVAGLFLAMIGLTYALAAGGLEHHKKRIDGAAIALASFLPPVFLSVAFPEGGWAPFPFSAFIPIPIFCVACMLLLPRRQRVLRLGVAIYGVSSVVALLFETPMGGNAVRLGALFGGPVLLSAIWGRHLRGGRVGLGAVVALMLGLFAWQWSAPVRDVVKYEEDPAAKAGYFDELKEELKTLTPQRRIEIPFTRSHWEAAEIAPDFPLARGWLRQLDTGHNPIFYKGQLNRLTYASWLAENAVRYVALPNAIPDKSSYQERALIERGLPYLQLIWRGDNWRLYEVILPAPFVIPEGQANIVLEQLGRDQLLLDVKRPGAAIVRVRWTPYWFARHACVERHGSWTRVIAKHRGFVHMSTRFSLERVFSRGRRCDS
ncbi:MAG TPA: hypothetical protein VH256_05490 [Thermoleophilaceae bacterium]|nr:hypothetical protein [Thermoleophilaceae bacterium]